MLDQLDPFANIDDEKAFLAAVARLAPSTTTLVIGTPVPPRSEHPAHRQLVVIDLSTLSTEGLVK
jgi:hypothetical protein